MATAHLQMNDYYSRVPEANRWKLDREIDFEHGGVPTHLNEIANAMDEWEGDVATKLGLTLPDVAGIKSDFREKFSLQTRRALQLWQEKKGPNSTYRNLIDVFIKAEKASFAEAVCDVLSRLNQASRDARSSLSNVGMGNHQETSSKRYDEVKKEIVKKNEAMIVRSFSKLVIQVRNALTEERIDMEIFHLYLTQLFQCDMPESQNITEIFKYAAKKRLWSYSHYSPLESIAEEFAKPQTQLLLDNYKKQLGGFYSTTKLLDFIDTCQDDDEEADPDESLKTGQFDRAYYRKLTVKLGRRITNETLQYVDVLWRYLADTFLLPSLTALLDRVVTGSLVITWWIPDFIATQIRAKAEGVEAELFYRAHQIMDVMIDDECLYTYRADGKASAITEYQDPVESLGVECEEEIPTMIKDEKADDDSEQQDSIAKSYQESGEPGGFTCQFVEQPPQDAIQSECPVCLQILREPHQVTCCGNSFCRVCIERIETENQPCPTCKEKEITFFRDKRLQRSLYNYKVYCTHKEDGCDWTGELGQLENHLNENPQPDRELEGCLFTCVECRFKLAGCDVKPHRGDTPGHLKDHSQIHLELLQKSDSSLNEAFIEDQQQISKLSQQNLGVKKTLSSIRENHEREISQLNREMRFKTEEQKIMKEQYEKQLADVNVTLSRMTEEYKRLQNQIRKKSQTLPPSSQVSVGQTSDPVLGIGTPIPPVTFIMTNFDELKRDNAGRWYSPPFYTHHHGYKMCLRVDPNGHPDSEYHGTHVSVLVYMKKGEFDDNLKWPFRGEIGIRILDQDGKEKYYSKLIPFDNDTSDNVAGRVTEGTLADRGVGWPNFIPHRKLERYLKNNCLMFQIYSVRID